MAECAVRPVVVVMVLVLAKHGCGVPQVNDEDPVEEFASDAADEAFGDRVGSRCPHRCLDDADTERGEHGVERCGELSVTVPDEKPEAAAGVCVPETRCTSCDLLILVEQPAESVTPSDVVDLGSGGFWQRS